MPSRAVMLLVVGALASVLLPLPLAWACTCPQADPQQDLRKGDAVAVVTGTADQQPEAAMRVRSVPVRVERVLRGKLPPAFGVRTRGPGDSCGFELERGRTTGVTLEKRAGGWWAALCDRVPAGALLAAAGDLPEPATHGPPMLVVAGQFGEASLAVVDAEARPIAWGGLGGFVHGLAACPQGRRFVTVTSIQEGTFTTVHQASDAGELRRVRLEPPKAALPWPIAGQIDPRQVEVACQDPEAEKIVVTITRQGAGGIKNSRALLVEGTAVRRIAQARVEAVAVGRGKVWFVHTSTEAEYRDRRKRLVAIDTATGARRELVDLSAIAVEALAPSPDGQTIAVTGYEDGSVGVTVVTSDDPRVFARRDRSEVVYQQALWLDADRFLLRNRENGATVAVDRNLRTLAKLIPMPGWSAALAGSTLYAAGYDVRLHAASLGTQPRPIGPLHFASAESLLSLVPGDPSATFDRHDDDTANIPAGASRTVLVGVSALILAFLTLPAVIWIRRRAGTPST